MFFPFQTPWAQLTLLLTLFSMVIAFVRGYSKEQILLQSALLLLLGRDTYCITTGKCNVTSWTIIILPVLVILFYGAEAMGVIKPKLTEKTLETFRRWNNLDVEGIDKEFPKLVPRDICNKYECLKSYQERK
jgi:ABC-type amino acid transport system permease subunit